MAAIFKIQISAGEMTMFEVPASWPYFPTSIDYVE